MSTVGRTSTSGNNHYYQNTGTNNMVATKITMPADGTISEIHVYVAGDSTSCSGALGIWNSSGTLLASGTLTLGAGSLALNGQVWNQVTGLALSATNGEVLYIGFWRTPSHTADYSTDLTSGFTTVKSGSQQSGSIANFNSMSNTTAEALSAYIVYTASSGGGARIRRSGVWNTIQPKIRRSGVWNAITPEIRRSGVWDVLS